MKKTFSLLLSFTLLALSAGQAPYAAAAGNIGVKGSPMGGSPVIAIAPSALPGGALNLPGTGSIQTFTVLSAGVTLPASSIGAVGAPNAAASQAAAANAAAKIAAASKGPAANTNSEKAAVTAQGQLTQGADAILPAASAAGQGETGVTSLNQVFSGSAKQRSAEFSVAGQDGKGFSPLGRPSAGQASGFNGNDSSDEPPAPAPKQSIGRSANVGLLAAVIPMALTIGALVLAQALGYNPNPNYQSPFDEGTMTVAGAAAILVGASVMAPISEEIIFRGGLMGWLQKLSKNLPKIGAFWLPATLSSLVFVAVHETSDPLLFTTRFVHSMIMSYAFHKEGYTGSIFAHGFFNALAVAGLVVPVLLPGVAGMIAMLAMWPVAIGFSIRAARKLRAQKEDKASGRLAAFEVSWKLALAFAAILGLGYFTIMGNMVWAVGAFAWLWYAYKKWHEAKLF